jgi:hypothetical protein
MNDPSFDMKGRYRAMLMQRMGEARMIMGCAMRDAAGIPGGVEEL